ncbi:hypothetical protein KAR28_04815 [Candidatus Parcubacteria bacterium]|nr:hypothetical protein [Candidatus Parcubacteria bacterium]
MLNSNNANNYLFGLIVLSMCLSSCTDSYKPATVTAEVYKESYEENAIYNDVAYRVNITVKNCGENPIVYDTAICAFVPSSGRPLFNKIYIYDEARGNNEENYRRDLKTDVIESNLTRMFTSTTNGFTYNLLHDAGSLPLQIVFTLLIGNSEPAQSVIGSYGANLPDIQTLPQYTGVTNTKGKKITLHLR